VRFERLNSIVAKHARLSVADTKHQRNIRSINVSVKQADFESHLRERNREVDCERSLANATLAGTNSNDVIYSG
jgi:hypothetical protein